VTRNGFLLALVALCVSGTSTLQAPTLPAILTLGAFSAIALLCVALVRVRTELGTLFGQSLPAHRGHQ
jgi:hypothetical protein